MKRKSVPIIIVSLLIALVFNWFFYGKPPGISVFIFSSLILGFTFYLAQKFRNPLNMAILWLSPVILFFSLMVFVRANEFLAAMNIFIVLYLLAWVVRLGHQPNVNLSHYKVFQYISLLTAVPLRIAGEAVRFLLKLVSGRNTAEKKSSAAPVIRGLILSLPVLVIFLILLSSADLVFKQYVGSLFNPDISPETIFRLGLIGFVASMFMGAYALIFMPTSRPEADHQTSNIKFGLGTTESSVILGSVGLLFFAFVMVQLAYLFGGADQIVATGHTYAEYARKGFFELITVAALSLALILTIKNSTTFLTKQQAFTFKWLSGTLVALVLVIMLSAHMRLNLYEEAYGFTTLRLVSHLFILWLAIAFALLLFHIVREESEGRLASRLFTSALCFFAVINIINPDNFIAQQNINRFNRSGKLDPYYLSNLSEDAAPAIAGLLDHPNKELKDSAANMLYKQQRRVRRLPDNWQSANLSRSHANQIFRSNAAQIEASKLFNTYPDLNAR
ncbi:MAG TPA: DUF4153 domain-containing protein [Candidatus Limnocylindrales bacterium]|nr:DUF4153 domain-containing protein [Candidatus Limnocylindrales bacterium]